MIIADDTPEYIEGWQYDLISSLIETSLLDEERAVFIKRKLPYMTFVEAEECISYLNDNQIDQLNPSERDYAKMIKKRIDREP